MPVNTKIPWVASGTKVTSSALPVALKEFNVCNKFLLSNPFKGVTKTREPVSSLATPITKGAGVDIFSTNEICVAKLRPRYRLIPNQPSQKR